MLILTCEFLSAKYSLYDAKLAWEGKLVQVDGALETFAQYFQRCIDVFVEPYI